MKKRLSILSILIFALGGYWYYPKYEFNQTNKQYQQAILSGDQNAILSVLELYRQKVAEGKEEYRWQYAGLLLKTKQYLQVLTESKLLYKQTKKPEHLLLVCLLSEQIQQPISQCYQEVVKYYEKNINRNNDMNYLTALLFSDPLGFEQAKSQSTLDPYLLENLTKETIINQLFPK